MQQTAPKTATEPRTAIIFVVLLGIVSLFGDVVYEGARSVTGPFLATLGANAFTVGFVAGLGECLGYVLRLFSGRLTDRTRQHWPIMFVGYFWNVMSIPLLAFVSSWIPAAGLLICERTGKAMRSPARDQILSEAATEIGRGHAFGLHQTLDQIGAIAGPLIVAGVLYETHDYRVAFGLLFIPAVTALLFLESARRHAPKVDIPKTDGAVRLSRGFYIYSIAMMFVAAGYVDFPLIAYHLYKHLHIDASLIPLFYAGAMAMEALVSLPLGRLFDRAGLGVVAVITFLTVFAIPLAFLGNFQLLVLGIMLWGIGMAAQNSIAKAAIAGFVPAEHRGKGFGMFGAMYGVAWFIGSALLGKLYDVNIMAMVALSVALQCVALPLLLVSRRASQQHFE